MSRKQEIYRDMLFWALPQARNCLSWFYDMRLFTPLLPKWRRALREQYEISELVHSLYVSILEEEFTGHDIYFLNFGARRFFERNSDKTCFMYSLFVYHIQELFQAVPEEKRGDLKWTGPPGDYSWARPRRGWELGIGFPPTADEEGAHS